MVDILETKRAATRFRILVEIAERQPAVNQGEIADAVGVTHQAVSEYIRELVADGHVEREGRSRYAVTKEGVDWMLQAAADVRRFANHVTEDVLGTLEEDAAIAAASINTGDQVGLYLSDGLLTADPDVDHSATGHATNDADPGAIVGVTNFAGVMDLEPGSVTVYQVPSHRANDDPNIDLERIAQRATDDDLLLCAGVEAVVAARGMDLEPDSWFAPGDVAADAAGRGLDIVVISTLDYVGNVTDRLRDNGISYDVIDANS